MLDFHTHILPQMDDGSDSVETSLAMLMKAGEQGARRLHLTPHFYGTREEPQQFLARRQRCYNQLLEGLGDAQVPHMRLGAEVAYYRGISNCDCLADFCIQGTNLILIEPPFTRWEASFYGDIDRIRRQGLRPVIAHVERYFSMEPQRQALQRLREVDALIQCNGEAFCKGWGSRKAFAMMTAGDVDFLGSDCHNLGGRAPNLGEAMACLQRKLGESFVEAFQTRAQQLVESCTLTISK